MTMCKYPKPCALSGLETIAHKHPELVGDLCVRVVTNDDLFVAMDGGITRSESTEPLLVSNMMHFGLEKLILGLYLLEYRVRGA